MGIKRWVLAVSILVVVSGLLALLFLQSGADEHVIEGLLPRIEDRLGVTVEYEDVEVSLTSVVFDDVVLTPVGGTRPVARLERLGVGVRVGPLLAGDLDLTGVRMNGLEIRMGEGASGASVDEWKALLERLSIAAASMAAEGDKEGEASKRPDISITSGMVLAGDGRFSLSVGSFSAEISRGGQVVVDAEDVSIDHGERRVLSGDTAHLLYRREGQRIVATLERPDFSIPAESLGFLRLARDARDTADQFGLRSARGAEERDAGAGGGGEPVDDRDGISLKFEVVDGTGKFLGDGGEEGVGEMALRKVSGEFSASREGSVSFRLSGSMAGTDARWTAAASWPTDGDPELTLEIPDMPLAKFGPLVLDSESVRWGKASADGVVKLQLLREGRKIAFDGQAALSGLELDNRAIASEPLGDLGAHLEFKGSYDRDEAQVQLERLLVSRGLARVTLRGDVSTERVDFDIIANVPPTACRQFLGAVPQQLRGNLEGVKVEGTIAMDLRLAIDREAPEETVLEVAMDNRCRITDFGSVRTPDEFRRPFAYTGYAEDGNRMRLISGPGTDRWTPYSMISPYVVEAALTTEDGRFRRHDGVTTPELRKAIELNLKKGSLSHGASTITMQLAKNLFLTRERTLSRKLQELFFTWYLESYFPKDEILELYFNVIEFGPSIYGIREAAEHYFGRSPHELNLVESVFLIKQLPNPVDRYGTYVRGAASDRKMASLRRVMNTMHARGRISKEELEEGLSQILEFHHEGDPLPEPRDPVMRDGRGDVAGAATYDEDGISAQQTW